VIVITSKSGCSMLIGCGSQPFLYPHWGQKSALAGIVEPQLAQFAFSSIVIPHWWQNLAP